MTIDLNGHSISRIHSNNKEGGHVIEVRNNGNLTLTSTANDYGVIMGGKAINGEYSSVENIQSSINNPQSAGWYSLEGRKLSGVPAQKGIYINNGKKMVIK